MRYRVRFDLLNMTTSDLITIIRKFSKMENWCRDNISGRWETVGENTDIFFKFENENDYLLFVLKWK